LVSDLKGRDHIANRVIDGGWRIMLKWMSEKWGVNVWTGFKYLRWASQKAGTFLDYPCDSFSVRAVFYGVCDVLVSNYFIWTNHHHHHHHHSLSRIRPLGLFRFRIYFLKLTNLSDDR
jgi:hypothetical protein